MESVTHTKSAVAIQVAISPKGLDATAITATDTVRRLLGFGDRLRQLRRQRWLEVSLSDDSELAGAGQGRGIESILPDLDAYVGQSFSLWNPNKERCWIRLKEGKDERASAEFVSNVGRRDAGWGDPRLDGDRWDHLVIWDVARGSARASDLPSSFGGRSVVRVTSGDVYSFRWGSAADESTRRSWVEELAVVRGRGHGLLVQPHYQDHAIYCGPVPSGLGVESPQS